MNFFEEQDQARRSTHKLIILFVLAVLSLILVTVIAIHALFYFGQNHDGSFITGLNDRIFSLQMFYITFGILIVVGAGSLFKYIEVSKGGSYVAQKLGGVAINFDNANAQQKVLLNIVEEMSIASGIIMPKVYVLPEPSLNAFAAGHSTNNAIIGVTQGLLDALNRDQLQGVIAHEFSHIYHGDMSINMKLLAVLHGILMIGLLGELIVGSRRSRYSRHSSNRSQRSDGSSKIAILGLLLLVFGYAGVFFGNLIKAAISRQREFLADASAVQFTRNKQGIGSALYVIGKQSQSSILESSNAKEFGHFYFSAGATGLFSGWFATHPPIKDRIKRIYPHGYSEALLFNETNIQHKTQPEPTKTVNDVFELDPQQSIVPLSTLGQTIENIGQFDHAHLAQAEIILTGLPLILKEACHHPFDAQCLVFTILTHNNLDVLNTQNKYLETNINSNLFSAYLKLLPESQGLNSLDKLTLIQLAANSLKDQSPEQFKNFMHHCKHLIHADHKIDIFEWCVFQILHAVYTPKVTKQTLSLHESEQAVRDLFYALIQSTSSEHQQQAAQAGFERIYPQGIIEIFDKKTSALSFLESSISKIKQLKALEQPILLKGIAKTIEFDGVLDENEAQIFRALGIILDCPMPVLLVN
ncbi:M48 family metallopeptidase [Marinicellulosiphila megalodicopiae]|uniref:M48 family metallopeptidase n=1 Tax=Marinicellulosiphila megalodicopiae TaxID=2724896 RepID=UPI003BB0F2B6